MRGFISRLSIGLVLLAVLSAISSTRTLAAALRVDGDAFPCDLKPSVAQAKQVLLLRELGYSESVARRIVVGRPDLLSYILGSKKPFKLKPQGHTQKVVQKNAWNQARGAKDLRRAVTAYRGLCASPSQYDPRFNRFHVIMADSHSMFVSTELWLADRYATCTNGGSSLRLTFEFPDFLLFNVDGGMIWVVPRQQAPDDFTFLTEVQISMPGEAPRTVDFEDFCRWKRDLGKIPLGKSPRISIAVPAK